ncbi:MAG: hypothetical protein Q8P26_03870 [Candidatus Levybacteria bacterium]|nr:hypothetical protein [Candidatus Levybacteria bacterium]
MGRYYYSKKEEADCLKKVSVSFLKKHGYFNNGWKSGNISWSRNGEKTGNISIQTSIDEDEQYVRCIYTQTERSSGIKTDLDYKIPLTTTPCYFGGKRYWFMCPWYANKIYCGKRVGVLYLSNKYFACRHCNDLTYNSRNLSGIFKAAGQVISAPELDKLREQVKMESYAGKMTKRYKSYLKKERKALFQMQAVVMGMDKVYKRRS